MVLVWNEDYLSRKHFNINKVRMFVKINVCLALGKHLKKKKKKEEGRR